VKAPERMHINIIAKGSLDFLSEYNINESINTLGKIVVNNTTNNFEKSSTSKILPISFTPTIINYTIK
jgi:hypothetical protein